MSGPTLSQASTDPRVLVVLTRFVAQQLEWGAEAAAFADLQAIFRGEASSWPIVAVARSLLERREGRWELRAGVVNEGVIHRVKDMERAAEGATRFGVPIGLVWRALKCGVLERCEAEATQAPDRSRAFIEAVNRLTRLRAGKGGCS